MKRFSKIVILVLTVALVASCLTACGGSATAELLHSSESLVVFRVDSASDKATVLDALNYLKDQGKIDFETESSDYGAFLTSVNGKVNVSYTTEGYSWMIYSNDEDGSSTDFGVVNYEGEMLGQTVNGISTQSVKSGCIYALSFDRWSF